MKKFFIRCILPILVMILFMLAPVLTAKVSSWFCLLAGLAGGLLSVYGSSMYDQGFYDCKNEVLKIYGKDEKK